MEAVAEEVNVGNGRVWKVLIIGEQLAIVDEAGRMRHTSKCHASTGVHLAMLLAERRFDCTPGLERALVIGAEQFAAGNC
jgi:hypothetical protein